MCELLAQEPWCFHPNQIASLTDEQIERLYARPAIERAKHQRAELTSDTVSEMPTLKQTETKADHPQPDTPEFRSWVIAQFITMGMSRAAAEKKYEEQAKAGFE